VNKLAPIHPLDQISESSPDKFIMLHRAGETAVELKFFSTKAKIIFVAIQYLESQATSSTILSMFHRSREPEPINMPDTI
jgi:hypothetical protein